MMNKPILLTLALVPAALITSSVDANSSGSLPTLLSAVVLDVETGRSFSCDDPIGLALADRLTCASTLLPAAAPNSDEPVGWTAVWRTGNSITRTCGYYRAQDSPVFTTCQNDMLGEREVRAVILYYCQCNDVDVGYRTTGNVHNNIDRGVEYNGEVYGVWIDNAATGWESRICRDRHGSLTPGTISVGQISDQSNRNSPCYVGYGAIKGTWGAGVTYRATEDDADVKAEHQYIYWN